MNRWVVPACIATGLLCVRAGAQKWDVECDAATYGAEKRDAPNRNIDAGACLAPLESRPAPGGISARTLKHKPSKAARTEFDRSVQAWLKGRSEEAAALAMLNRWAEAEMAARRAVQLDPRSTAAQYMVGLAMLMQDKVTPEVVEHLARRPKRMQRRRCF